MIAPLCEQSPSSVAASNKRTGHFYVMLVCPDLNMNRVKLGFAKNVEKRLRLFATVSPTIRLIKSWPCAQKNESAIINHVTISDCKMIGREVVDFNSLDALIEKLDAVFAAENLPCYGENKYYYLPGKLATEIEKIAKSEVRSGSYMVKKACEAFVAEYRKKRKD